MKYKIATLLVAVAIMLAAGFTQAGAAHEDWGVACDLHKNERQNYSSVVKGTDKFIWGRNDSSSAHPVWFVAQYRSTNGEWEGDLKIKKEKGESFGESHTYQFGNSHEWRLMLDVYGPFQNCLQQVISVISKV